MTSHGAVPPSPVLPHPNSENSCDSFFRPVDLHGNRPLHAASAKRPEVGLGHLDRSVLDETKRILETKTRRNPTRKSVPPRARKRTKSGRVREGQNSRIRRPSESGHFLIEVLFKIGRFWARAGPGPVWGVFGGSKTGCPKGRPETPPRRSTTRSKSTRSSRLCSVSLSSVLSLVRFFFVTSSSVRCSFCVHRSD